MSELEPDLAAMLTGADNLDEAKDMLWLENMLDALDNAKHNNGIRIWIIGIMRSHGWREAHDALAAYAEDGCGVRG